MIKISTVFANNVLEICIEDNGCGLPENKLAELQMQLRGELAVNETSALFNINKRLMLRYNGRSAIKVETSEWGGLKVIIKIDTTMEEI